MKQQQSILQWASLMLEQEVKNLNSIQDVKFIKNLLWKTDPIYFAQWEAGKGTQNFAQVVLQIGKYFLQQIGTDIKHFIQCLNIYKKPMDLWELLLGIAIKGSNRGQNINLILDMDHNVQAQLVGIVSGIIDKFGQQASNKKGGKGQENEELEELEDQHQLLIDLMKEHQELSYRMEQTEAELEKEKIDILNLIKQKKELQQQIFVFKLEKASFLETLANGNRTDSRIFEDEDENVLQTGNLTELANDIVIFVRDLRKKINQEVEKNSQLEQQLRHTKFEAAQAAEQNQTYISHLNDYETQITQLRQEINEVFNQNSKLIDKINDLEEERLSLVFNLRRKTDGYLAEAGSTVEKAQEVPQKRKKRAKFQSQQQQDVQSVRSSEYLRNTYNQYRREQGTESEAERHKAKDQLREPKLKIRLEKEIQYLKHTNENLKRQNSSLKFANQNLQQTAKQFLLTNERIAKNWEQDFKLLMAHIQQMGEIRTQIADQAQSHQPVQQPSNAESVQAAEEPSDSGSVQVKHSRQNSMNQYNSVEQRDSEHQRQSEEQKYDQRERQQEKEKEKARQLQNKLDSITQQMTKQNTTEQKEHKNEAQIWKEIVIKLKGLVNRFKENQINYQNTIHSLKMQNSQLIKSLQQSIPTAAPQYKRALAQISLQQQVIRHESSDNSELKIAQPNQYRNSEEQIPRMSFLSIQQGEEMDEDFVNRRHTDFSHFYKAESKLVNEIVENLHISQLQESEPQGKYISLNRKLFSQSKASLFNIKKEISDSHLAKNSQLEARFREQIKKMEQQYSWLNGSYQQLFRKLNIYTDQLRVKEYAKLEGLKLLQQLQNSESQLLQNKESEIVKLSELNRQLRGALIEQAAKKQELMQVIRQIEAFCRQFFKNKESSYELGLSKMMLSLEEITRAFSESMKQPLQFLEMRTMGAEGGKAEQFYRLYSKEKQKNRQLNCQLELLASTLLQYRNILQF